MEEEHTLSLLATIPDGSKSTFFGDGNFLTFEEFQNKFRIKTNYLHYFQLMAAIPSDLKKKAMSA